MQSPHMLPSFVQQHQETNPQMSAILQWCLGKLLSYHAPFMLSMQILFFPLSFVVEIMNISYTKVTKY